MVKEEDGVENKEGEDRNNFGAINFVIVVVQKAIMPL